MTEATLPRKTVHWADFTAERIINERGEKDLYVCASGITPSGMVHFGNFREVITTEFVVRALKDRGKKVRFIFSWDDFDTFRKVPVNLPRQEELQKFLFNPIVDTPDPFGRDESYARHHEVNFEKELQNAGILIEPVYQAKCYRKGQYSKMIQHALDNTDKIKAILNQYREEPLSSEWLPVLIYCEKCNRDRIKKISYNNKDSLSYECELCNHTGVEKIENSTRIKLPWRVDWPMRWAYEKVDFEPGGKDHSSEGGSFTTAKSIVKYVFGGNAPIYLQYDFISIKGMGGKMSSSKGNLVTVSEVLKIYEPEMIRWIFASYKSNVDFAIGFDAEVIKNYEDFDRLERSVYGLEPMSEKKRDMNIRVYELSQLVQNEKLGDKCPFQPSFRHLTNLLQIQDGSIERTRKYYEKDIVTDRDERRFQQRSQCALNWLNEHAPEEFKFKINKTKTSVAMDETTQKFIQSLSTLLKNEWDSIKSDNELHEKIYHLINDFKIEPPLAFKTIYQMLISKDRGPKLATFIREIGKEKILAIFN
ncbi:MAG: lysine--tRNA ligase [Bacteriovoracaceae bacterium]